MTISYNWLGEYLQSELTPEQMSVVLTDIGLEVEGLERVESIRGGLRGVVVGEVLTCEQHPDADKLKLTTVNIGEKEPLQIVCGAPNVAVGQRVVVATVGTELYKNGEEKPFKIGRSKIRGVESFGMICSEDELGIGEATDGIMVLDASVPIAMEASELFDLKDDYIIEIGLTPNRADGASHYGVARDLAAWLKANDKKYRLIKPSVDEFRANNGSRRIDIEVVDKQGAVRYAGVTMTGVKVAPSPKWLQEHLKAIGVKPINNIVDLSNFILHETGQPLHIFDADKIAGDKIVVQSCKEGTKITTLDQVERTLSGEDLMICSTTTPLCIAGVFGGAESGVSNSTTNIFIESAYFDSIRVRKSARRHGLNTDASFRFERGIDPEMVIYALKRAALLVKELAGGEISSEIIDVYPQKIEPFRFSFSLPYMTRLLGQEIPEATVRTILSALEVEVESEKNGVLSVAVPAYRVDVQRQADLIEDILRIYGYNKIEIPLQVNSTISYAPSPDKDKLTNMVADMLSAQGFAEAMSNSLTKASYYEEVDSYKAENCVKILNPLSNDLGVMRQTLLFGMLEAVELNIHRKNSNLKLYEFGNCYRYDENKRSAGNALSPYYESTHLAILTTGLQREPSWNEEAQQSDYYNFKGVVEKLLRRFGVDIYTLQSSQIKSDLYSDMIGFKIQGVDFLQMGVVDSGIAKRFDIKKEVYYLELDFDRLINATSKHNVVMEEISKFPEVERDLALLIDKGVSFYDLRRAAFTAERKLLKSVALFDVYEGDKLPAGKKSYALRFILEDSSQTLTDKMIERTMGNIAKRLETECKAEVRHT